MSYELNKRIRKKVVKKRPRTGFLKSVHGNPEKPATMYYQPYSYPYSRAELSNPNKVGLDLYDQGWDDFSEPHYHIGDVVYVITRNFKIKKTHVTAIEHYGPPGQGYLIEYQIHGIGFPGPGACSSQALYNDLRTAKEYLAFYKLYNKMGMISQRTFIRRNLDK